MKHCVPLSQSNFLFNGMVPGLAGRRGDGGTDVWINKKMTLELAELADGHSLLGFHYLGTCHLALPLMGLLM